MAFKSKTVAEQTNAFEGNAEIIRNNSDEIDKSLTFTLSEEVKKEIAHRTNAHTLALERGNHDAITSAQGWLAELAGENEAWQESQFTPAHGEANKYFVASILHRVHALSRQGKYDEAEKYAASAYDAYFSASPSIAEYVGDINSEIELLEYARRSTPAANIARSLQNELVYKYAFYSDHETLGSVFKGKDAINQTALVETMGGLAQQAISLGEWAEPFAQSTGQALDVLSSSPESSAFVRIMAERTVHSIRESLYQEWIDLEELPLSEQERLLDAFLLRQAQADQMQALLHRAFPQFDANQTLVRLAPDIACSTSNGLLGEAISLDGKMMNISDYREDNEFNLSEAELLLLRTVHGSDMKSAVEGETGLYLDQLNIDVQKRVLTFMIEASPDRYRRLVEGLTRTPEHMRAEVAKAFLSTEFGDDFGDTILSIAEYTTEDQTARLFEIINNFRKHAAGYAAWFEPLDLEFAVSAEQALNERLTDVLAAVEEVARTGGLRVDTAPHRRNPEYVSTGRFDSVVDSVDEAIEIMALLDSSMDTTRRILADPEVRVHRTIAGSEWFQIYRFSSPQYGDTLLHVRSHGAGTYDKALEYGNFQGVEATVSFVVNPIDPHHLALDKDPNGVSIRFDREGRLSTEAPDTAGRHPTREEGSISLDISSILGDANTPAVRIGRLVAAGNLLRASKVGSDEALHHNTNHFNQEKYGSAEGFARLVNYVDTLAKGLITQQAAQNLGSAAGQAMSRSGALPQQ